MLSIIGTAAHRSVFFNTPPSPFSSLHLIIVNLTLLRCHLAAGQYTAHPTSAAMTGTLVFPRTVFREAHIECANLFILWRVDGCLFFPSQTIHTFLLFRIVYRPQSVTVRHNPEALSPNFTPLTVQGHTCEFS